jgi:hypothetical protein
MVTAAVPIVDGTVVIDVTADITVKNPKPEQNGWGVSVRSRHAHPFQFGIPRLIV